MDRLEDRWKSLCLKTFLSGALREAHQENQGKEKPYHTENNMARKHFLLSGGSSLMGKAALPQRRCPEWRLVQKSVWGFP